MSATFGSWIKERRLLLGLTQEQLAGRVACARITIAKIEAGERRPSEQMAGRLAEALRVTPAEHGMLINWALDRQQARPRPEAETGAGQAASSPAEHLPTPLTPLIGRDAEVSTVRGLLQREGVRLLTLTGPPGIGKTRLALAVAEALAEQFEHGTWFVPLAPIAEPGLVASTIAQTLGLKESPGQGIEAVLRSYLRDKQLLLLLDNFEQVIAAAAVLSELLAAARRVKLLVTSRQALRIYGEYEFPVPPLALPERSLFERQALPGREGPRPQELARYASIELFVQRSQAVRPDFTLAADNARAVAEICVRLDGLPLAIELAGARSKLFAPQAILERLDPSLALLTGGPLDHSPRQRTLRGAIAWSYELLDPDERRLFRRMAAFRGGRSLDAVEAVAGDEEAAGGGDGEAADWRRPLPGAGHAAPGPRRPVLDLLSSLAEKSLLQLRPAADGEPRFWMLETIHAYARERLEESGEAASARRAHAEYFLSLAIAAERWLQGAGQTAWLEQLEIEHDNMRAALEWSLRESGGREDALIGLRMSAALGRFWAVRAHWDEGRRWLEKALARSRGGDAGAGAAAGDLKASQAKGLRALGELAWRQGSYKQAVEWFDESLHLHRELGDPRGAVDALIGRGVTEVDQSNYQQATALFEEGLALAKQVGHKPGLAESLKGLGLVAQLQGNYEASVQHFQESLATWRELESKSAAAGVLFELSWTTFRQGRYERAREFAEESLRLNRELGDRSTMGRLLNTLGLIAQQQEDYERAEALLTESLNLARELTARRVVGVALNNLGYLALYRGDPPRARRLLAEALQMFQEIGDRASCASVLINLGYSAFREGDFGRALALLKEALGMADELRTQRPIAECLERVAAVAGAMGFPRRAAWLFGAAEALREHIGDPLRSFERSHYEQDVAVARATLDETSWQATWEQGRSSAVEQAVAAALEFGE